MCSELEQIDKELWEKAEWIKKYGLDFLRSYGEVNKESIKKLLNIGNDRYYVFTDSIKRYKESRKDDKYQKDDEKAVQSTLMNLSIVCHKCTCTITMENVELPDNWYKVIKKFGWVYNSKTTYFLCKNCNNT